ncbi:hypothetical protein DH86_00001678 [Scytalidium sp. 3C]|nr:hypothetical protein DH86_00001678 [Scytalidium sp. 3C]
MSLALLESRIYTELYSIRSRNRSTTDRLRSVGQLDKALQEWLATLPPEIQSSDVIRCSKEIFVPVVLMHFSYLNCLSTVHRISIHYGAGQDLELQLELHDRHLSPRVFESQAICLSAARRSIRLLQCLDLDLKENMHHCNLIWVVLYYALASFLTLFANTLQCPQDPNAESDLELMGVVTNIVGPAASRSPFKVASSIKIFLELRNVAAKFIQKVKDISPQPAKRSFEGFEMEQIDEVLKQEANTPAQTPAINLPTEDLTTPQVSSSNDQNLLPPTGFNQFDLSPESQQVVNDIQSFVQQPHLTQNIDTYDNFNEPVFGDAINQELPVAGDPTVFTGYFEYDLLNLWNQGYMSPGTLQHQQPQQHQQHQQHQQPQ